MDSENWRSASNTVKMLEEAAETSPLSSAFSTPSSGGRGRGLASPAALHHRNASATSYLGPSPASEVENWRASIVHNRNPTSSSDRSFSSFIIPNPTLSTGSVGDVMESGRPLSPEIGGSSIMSSSNLWGGERYLGTSSHHNAAPGSSSLLTGWAKWRQVPSSEEVMATTDFPLSRGGHSPALEWAAKESALHQSTLASLANRAEPIKPPPGLIAPPSSAGFPARPFSSLFSESSPEPQPQESSGYPAPAKPSLPSAPLHQAPIGARGQKGKKAGIVIKGCPSHVRMKDILEICAPFGEISDVSLNQGVAIVFLDSFEAVFEATAFLSSTPLFGLDRPLEISLTAQPTLSPSPLYQQQSLLSPESPSSAVPSALRGGSVATPSAAPAPVHLDYRAAVARQPAATQQRAVASDQPGLATPATKVDHYSVFFANLPAHANKQLLERTCSAYGPIVRSQILPGNVNTPGGSDKVMAFVEFRSIKSAEALLSHLNGKIMFGSTIPLRIEFAKRRLRKSEEGVGAATIESISTSAPEAGESVLANNGLYRRRRADHVLRTIVYVKSSEGSIDDIQRRLERYGTVLSSYSTSVCSPHASSAGYILFAFKEPSAAEYVVKNKILGAMFPRQRRLILENFPPNVGESDIRTFFADIGDLKMVDFRHAVQQVWIEFMEGEEAARAVIKCGHYKLPFSGVHLRARYAPSAKKEEKDNELRMHALMQGGIAGGYEMAEKRPSDETESLGRSYRTATSDSCTEHATLVMQVPSSSRTGRALLSSPRDSATFVHNRDSARSNSSDLITFSDHGVVCPSVNAFSALSLAEEEGEDEGDDLIFKDAVASVTSSRASVAGSDDVTEDVVFKHPA